MTRSSRFAVRRLPVGNGQTTWRRDRHPHLGMRASCLRMRLRADTTMRVFDKDTTGHLEIAFKFHPRGYTPKFNERIIPIGTGDIDIRPMESGQKVEAFMTLTQPTKVTVFEPHMHAAAVRMCFDAIYGSRMETLSCSGYDHSWVRAYQYADEVAPLLPRGTIVRITGYYDNTPANRNVVDPR